MSKLLFFVAAFDSVSHWTWVVIPRGYALSESLPCPALVQLHLNAFYLRCSCFYLKTDHAFYKGATDFKSSLTCMVNDNHFLCYNFIKTFALCCTIPLLLADIPVPVSGGITMSLSENSNLELASIVKALCFVCSATVLLQPCPVTHRLASLHTAYHVRVRRALQDKCSSIKTEKRDRHEGRRSG